MRAPVWSLVVALALAGLGAGCSCERGPSLSGQQGELVVVVPAPRGELLTREAVVSLEPVVMEATGTGQVRLRNVGVAPLSLVAVTREGGSDALTLDDAPGLVIPRDGEVTLTAHFAPPTDADSTRATVEHRADFVVEVSGGRPGESVARVTLVAQAVARDCYVPAVLDFGAVPLGQHVTLPLVLENGRPFAASTEVSAPEGADPLAFALPSPGPFDVDPGQRLEVPVGFGPLEERAYQATLRVRRAPTCAEGVTRLVGVGSSQALTWAPALVDFGRVPLDVPVTRTVTVVNGSGADLALEGTVAEGAAYALVDPVPLVVPARGQATLTVACRPTAVGRVEGVLRFDIATVERLSARVPLTCMGGAPRIRLSPSPALAFGSVPIGVVASRRLSVQSVGTPPAFPGDASNNLRLGVDGRLPWVAIVPLNANTKVTDFEIVIPPGYDASAGLPAVGGLNTLDLDVRLLVSDGARREADLLVYSNDPVQPVVTVRVSATPTAPGDCDLSITPTVLPMGDVPRGAFVERTVTIAANVGTSDCLVTVDMAPGSAPAVTLPEGFAPFVLNDGQSRAVKVRATADPALPFGATARGFVRVQAGVSPPKLLPVEMRVANCLVIEPNAVDFGMTKVGCRSASKTINAYNACGVPLYIDALGFRAPGPFAMTVSPTIPPGGLAVSSGQGPTTTQVAYAPVAVGASEGDLDFTVREGGQTRTLSVTLKGEGDLVGIQTDSWTQESSGKLDILFVVDDSCSMSDEQASLAANFGSFIAAANQSNTDYHLGVTTTDLFKTGGQLVGAPAVLTSGMLDLPQAFAQNVQVGTRGSGIEQPFEAATRAITAPLLTGANAGFLRSDASLAIVIVTDAEEQSTNPVSTYRSTYRLAKGGRAARVSVSVVGPFSPPSSTCFLDSGQDTGRYAEMVNTTGGVMADICTTNWAQSLATVGENLVQPRLVYPLTSWPENASTVQVKVNGVVVTNWTWNATNNTIVFPASAPPPPGASVTATYGTACF